MSISLRIVGKLSVYNLCPNVDLLWAHLYIHYYIHYFIYYIIIYISSTIIIEHELPSEIMGGRYHI